MEAGRLGPQTWRASEHGEQLGNECGFGPSLCRGVHASADVGEGDFELSAAWHVYALIDPRSGSPFYVGITSRPEARRGGHTGDPASAAYNRCYEIKMAGHRVAMEILSTHETKMGGLAEEAHQISSLPGLVNLLKPSRTGESPKSAASRTDYQREVMKLRRAKQQIPRIEAELKRLRELVGDK